MTHIQTAVKALVDKHGGLRAAARAINMTPAYLSRLGNGIKSNPSDPVLRKLGLQREVVFTQRRR